jgi:hypothetical protein
VRTYCRLAASAAASAVDLLLGPCAIPDSLRPDGVQDAELARCMRDAAMRTRGTNVGNLLKSHELMVSMMAGEGGLYTTACCAAAPHATLVSCLLSVLHTACWPCHPCPARCGRRLGAASSPCTSECINGECASACCVSGSPACTPTAPALPHHTRPAPDARVLCLPPTTQGADRRHQDQHARAVRRRGGRGDERCQGACQGRPRLLLEVCAHGHAANAAACVWCGVLLPAAAGRMRRTDALLCSGLPRPAAHTLHNHTRRPCLCWCVTPTSSRTRLSCAHAPSASARTCSCTCRRPCACATR